MKTIINQYSHQIILLLITITVFLVSVSIYPFAIEMPRTGAWGNFVNERHLTLGERYIQFNVDITDWVTQVRDFPNHFRKDQLRVNRPSYIFLGAVSHKLLGVLTPEKFWSIEKRADLMGIYALLGLNLFLSILTIQLFYKWISKRFQKEIALGSALLLAASGFFIKYNATASPEVWGVFTSITIIYLLDTWFINSAHTWSWKRVFISGILIGILMLGKAQYTVLLACFIWAVMKKKWRVLYIGLIQFIPLILWLIVLSIVKIPYYNHEISAYRQVVWVFDDIGSGNWSHIYPFIAHLTGRVFSYMTGIFPWTILAVPMLILPWIKISKNTKDLIQIIFILFFSINLFLAAIQRVTHYLVFDIAICLFPLVAASIWILSEQIAKHIRPDKKYIFAAIFGLFFVITVYIDWTFLTFQAGSEFLIWPPDYSSFTRFMN
ncbi:MAG: glycosyltransferase family 39 protein [Anaerolineaceae bacterium]|nr:glycosyltransferase family 39 protein [Anaerolineaceae bacterium]